MNESHPIDELFQSKLQNYELPAPMHLWGNIDRQRHKPKGLLWWLSKYWSVLTFGLITAGFLSYWLFQKKPTVTAPLHHFPIPLADQRMTADQTTSSAEEESTLSFFPKPNQENIAEAATPSLRNSILTPDADRSDTNNAISTNILTQTPDVASTPPLSSPNSPGDQKSKTAVSEQDITAPMQEYRSGAESSRAAEKRVSLATARLLQTPLPGFLAEKESSFETPEWPIVASYNGNGIVYFVEAYGSPGFANRSVNPISNNFSFLADEIEAAQLDQSSLAFGLRLAAVNRKGWTLRTGFHFTQINESFEFVNHVPRVQQIYDPQGGELVEETIYVPSGAPVNSNIQYSLLDVPVLLGYQKRHQRWTFSAQAGPIFNLSFNQEGTLINANRQLVSLATLEAQSAFRPQLGINWYGGLGIQYEIHPGIHLMVEPHLRWQQRSFTTTYFPVQQKFMTGGVSFGVRRLILNR